MFRITADADGSRTPVFIVNVPIPFVPLPPTRRSAPVFNVSDALLSIVKLPVLPPVALEFNEAGTDRFTTHDFSGIAAVDLRSESPRWNTRGIPIGIDVPITRSRRGEKGRAGLCVNKSGNR